MPAPMITTSVSASVSGLGGVRHFRLREARLSSGQILAHHRDILVRHHFAGSDRHHLAEQRIVGLPRRLSGMRCRALARAGRGSAPASGSGMVS